MKNSGIGGQALMEGVMMRNGKEYACAVRKTDGEIVLQKEKYKTIGGSDKWRKIPFVRGPFIFLDSLKLGFETLSWSSGFFMEEEESEAETNGKKGETLAMGFSVVLAVLLAVGLFIVLPSALVRLLKNVIGSRLGIALAEGLIRLVIFLLYLYLISQMKEIRRVFMYHGAEHKCISCIEHGLPLTVENVRKSTRFHKRCGTSFILFTLLVSIVVGIFLPKEPLLLRIGCKLLALPVVMSLSYEFIRLAGSTENPLIAALSKPGLWLQRLTTREPDDGMIEVGMASVEAVFDWKDWEEKNF
jgi:uncharacterized protein YqhQ